MNAARLDLYVGFVTEPSQPGDGPPEWPLNAANRIVGICCPSCDYESRAPQHRNAASFLKRVTCPECGWTGRVPL